MMMMRIVVDDELDKALLVWDADVLYVYELTTKLRYFRTTKHQNLN